MSHQLLVVSHQSLLSAPCAKIAGMKEKGKALFCDLSLEGLVTRRIKYIQILTTGQLPQAEIEITQEVLEKFGEPYDDEELKRETFEGIQNAVHCIDGLIAIKVKSN